MQELLEGRIQSAVDCFNQSLLSCPTAEGYTYRGWAVSFLGMLEQAVEDCRKAIRVDPEFGNPYNDIGVYMMQLGLLDEAIPWLESAKLAKRYEPRHFPYLNLGHVYRARVIRDGLEEYVRLSNWTRESCCLEGHRRPRHADSGMKKWDLSSKYERRSSNVKT